MNRWLRLIYPAAFHRRHGEEIAELLARSRRPVRDRLDVVIHAATMRSEQFMTNLTRHAADVTLAVALVVFGFMLNDLAGGVAEILRHWWSTAALASVVVAGAARAVVARRRDGVPASAVDEG